MNEEEEKVCLTAGQIENIGKAYAKEIEGKEVVDPCPKAVKWVKGFFGNKKKKKQKPKNDRDPLEKAVENSITRRLNRLVDDFF